jgi:hypothetical protein
MTQVLIRLVRPLVGQLTVLILWSRKRKTNPVAGSGEPPPVPANQHLCAESPLPAPQIT